MKKPQAADSIVELVSGAYAVAPGLLWFAASRTLVAADTHFGYEDVIGGVLPTWSTTDIAALLLVAARRLQAREIVFLGDIIHGSSMSAGAARAVGNALDALRAECVLTLVAGNHEGRTRGVAILGETVEHVEREGWLLIHGDRVPRAGVRCVIGHLHPSLRVGGGASIPAFLAGERVIVVPALTPYSPGLDVCSRDALRALAPFATTRRDVHVVAASTDRLFPFGTLSELQKAIARPNDQPTLSHHRHRLRPG
ncbi:MAG TPA: metallophosphoesterase [Candidatus Baltobacteraceae bacterium]